MMESLNPDLEKLFDCERLKTYSVTSLLWLCLYFPFGVVLCLVRMFVLQQAYFVAAIFPHGEFVMRYISRCMSFVLGLVCEQKNKNECNNRSRCLFVANHVTAFDGVALHFATGSVSPNTESFPSILHSILGLFERPHQRSRDDRITAVRQQLEGGVKSVLLFPELTTTSGKAGMLKFTTDAFLVQDVVQPVAIKVSRPSFLCVAPSVLESSWSTELFWFMFTPYTKYCIRYLPPVRKQEGEAVEDFARRAQESIASCLCLPITTFEASDKAELIKRKRREQETERHIADGGGELTPMALQVKEILPHVPMNVILQDLRRTRSVDVTVSHLVEGLIPFTPEPVPAPAPVSPSSSTSTNNVFPPLTPQTAATFPSAFHKKVEERQLSLHERKARLLANARRAYIEKHGLKIPGYNC